MKWQLISQEDKEKEHDYTFCGPILATEKILAEFKTDEIMNEFYAQLNEFSKTTRNACYKQIFQNIKTGKKIYVIDNKGLDLSKHVQLLRRKDITVLKSVRKSGYTAIMFADEYENIINKIRNKRSS